MTWRAWREVDAVRFAVGTEAVRVDLALRPDEARAIANALLAMANTVPLENADESARARKDE